MKIYTYIFIKTIKGTESIKSVYNSINIQLVNQNWKMKKLVALDKRAANSPTNS